jgi:hypothetical protein
MPGWRVVPDRPKARRPGRRGEVAFSLRSSHLLELAVSVMQNGWTPEEAHDHIAHSDRPVMSFAECASADTQPSALTMHATLAMLEDIYREVLHQNLEAVNLGRREGA